MATSSNRKLSHLCIYVSMVQRRISIGFMYIFNVTQLDGHAEYRLPVTEQKHGNCLFRSHYLSPDIRG